MTTGTTLDLQTGDELLTDTSGTCFALVADGQGGIKLRRIQIDPLPPLHTITTGDAFHNAVLPIAVDIAEAWAEITNP